MSVLEDGAKDVITKFIFEEKLVQQIKLIKNILKIIASIYTSILLYKYLISDIIFEPTLKNVLQNISDGSAIVAFIIFTFCYFVIYKLCINIIILFYKSSYNSIPKNMSADEISSISNYLSKNKIEIEEGYNIEKVRNDLDSLNKNIYKLEENIVYISLVVVLVLIQVPYFNLLVKLISIIFIVLLLFTVFPYCFKYVYGFTFFLNKNIKSDNNEPDQTPRKIS